MNYTHFDPTTPPPPLMTSEPDSFAYKTIAIRKPSIVRAVLADHAGLYPPEIVAALQALHDDLAQGRPVRPLVTTAADGPDWHSAWQPYRHKTWSNLPWYFAEVFFYRSLLEAAAYFGNGPWAGVDPFLPRKQAELRHEASWRLLSLAVEYAAAGAADNFCALLRHNVWGNQVDLSHPQLVEEIRKQTTPSKQRENLLTDATEAVLSHLQQSPSARLDFICDNAGAELLLDLALTDFLLRFDWAGHITLHVKSHPTFVSDTVPADIEMTLAALQAHGEKECAALADRLQSYRQGGRLRVWPHLYWNSSRFFWDMPADLRAELAQANLVILKGDANYRRLLGDSRAWPTTQTWAEVAPYFPAPFVTLRTMKSEAIVDLQPGQAETLDKLDPAWRVNGRRAVIQARLPKADTTKVVSQPQRWYTSKQE